MSHPSTAREALIVEALGDIARLLDRVDALLPALDATQRNMAQVNADLAHRALAFEDRMATTLEQGKIKTVERIVRQVDQAARQSLAEQTLAMTASARSIFNAEMGSSLQNMTASWRALALRVEKLEGPWDRWLTHAATAGVATVCTCALMVWLPFR